MFDMHLRLRGMPIRHDYRSEKSQCTHLPPEDRNQGDHCGPAGRARVGVHLKYIYIS